MAGHPSVVVLMTTWNRPKLLAQALTQVEQEAASIGAHLVIADDHSDDLDTLALLESAKGRGATLIRRDYVRPLDIAADRYVHSPKESLRLLLRTPSGERLVRSCLSRRTGLQPRPGETTELPTIWHKSLLTAHSCAQLNSLFGFGYVLDVHPRAQLILKIDDDVALMKGAFERMLSAWRDAERDGHDVLTVSGIRTKWQPTSATFPTYLLTQGICNVAVLYRSTDWAGFLREVPPEIVLNSAFDTEFETYAPIHRPGAVPVSVYPSVVYHAGLHGVNTRNEDLNCEYGGPTSNIIVE